MSGLVLIILVVIYCLVAFGLVCLGILFEVLDLHVRSRIAYSVGMLMLAALAILLLGIFGGFIYIP